MVWLEGSCPFNISKSEIWLRFKAITPSLLSSHSKISLALNAVGILKISIVFEKVLTTVPNVIVAKTVKTPVFA